MNSTKSLASAVFCLFSLLAMTTANAAIYRLELRDGTRLIERRDINSKKLGKEKVFVHSGLNGFAAEIKDGIASCGTFVQLDGDKSVMVTLVENSSVQTGKINSQMKSAELTPENSKTLQVEDPTMSRSCTIRLI